MMKSTYVPANLPFKYHVSILGGVGGFEVMLFLLAKGGGLEFIEPILYNNCMLPYVRDEVSKHRSEFIL